jgi:small GTP-binding protein
MKKSSNNEFKVTVLGDTQSGKSSIVNRFYDDQFTEDTKPTIGAHFKTKTLTINDSNVKLKMLDTAGQERYASPLNMYYKEAKAIIIVYDITNEDSFKKAKTLFTEVTENQNNKADIFIIGNKLDLVTEKTRKVSTEEAQKFADENKITFLEVSAKENTNINDLFNQVATKCLENKTNNLEQEEEDTLSILSKPKSNKTKSVFDPYRTFLTASFLTSMTGLMLTIIAASVLFGMGQLYHIASCATLIPAGITTLLATLTSGFLYAGAKFKDSEINSQSENPIESTLQVINPFYTIIIEQEQTNKQTNKQYSKL